MKNIMSIYTYKNASTQIILKLLAEHIPQAGPFLRFNNPFELLVAVILSAQCTDQRVNKTTARLFSKYSGPEDFAALSPEKLEDEIRDCGLYRNKSRQIIETSKILVEKYGGQVPGVRTDLESLPGVGRKTASVVLNVAFGKPAFPVDTHIYRVARRLGLSAGKTPRQVEDDMSRLLSPAEFGIWHHRLIHFGRNTCTARKPKCWQCVVSDYCYTHNKSKAGEGS